MLHPQARAALAAQEGSASVFDPGFDIDAARADELAAVGETSSFEEVDRVEDLDADGVRCRLYLPRDAAGVIVHLHGGGFVFHDIDVHDHPARRLANRAGMAVLSVDYRRPPEHRFPAAPDDVDTVIGWLGRERASIAAGPATYVHGDSAGGNLALVAALRNPGAFDGVALLYPFLDPTAGFDSYRTETAGFDPREAAWYWEQYLADPREIENPDVAPLTSPRLGTLPPTLVVTAEHDPLRDEGERLCELIAEAGGQVTGTRMLGQLHGFWRHDRVFDAADALTTQVAAQLRRWASISARPTGDGDGTPGPHPGVRRSTPAG